MGQPVRVLYVDDEPDFADMAAEFLERQSDRLRVQTTTSPAAAYETLAEEAVDCVISDYDMPDQDGLEFLRAVREDHPDLPFILYTGKGSEEVASDAMSGGVTDYFQKRHRDEEYQLLANRILDACEHQQSKANYEAIFEKIPEGIVIHDAADGTFVDMNRRYVELFGYGSKDEFLEAGFEAIHLGESPYTLERAGAQVQQAIDHGAHTFDWPGVRKDGSQFWAEVHLAPIELHGEDRVLAAVRDVTDRKAHERSLAELNTVAVDLDSIDTVEGICERTIEASREILAFDMSAIDIEADGLLSKVAASESVLPEDVTDMPVTEGLAGQTYRTGESTLIDDLEAHEAADPQGPYGSAISVPIGDHGVFQAVAESTGAFDERDLELAELLVKHTETTLNRLDRERELERRNERLDEFASVVSHDLRNPLNVAEGRLALAREAGDNEQLDAVAEALDRMETLIEDLLKLARQGDRIDATEPVQLSALIEACWEHVETGSARLSTETDLTVRADRSGLRQLLENLLRNAVEHGGSDVTVTVGALENGFYVADDGPGIPEAERDRVFEAGYSTTAQGTGFGLRIVRQIAEAHGWAVELTDSANGGARFEFTGIDRP